MRVLEVINSLELAGAERLVHDLCLEFQRRRVSVSVFLLRATGSPLENDLRDAAIPVFTSGPASLRSPLHAARLADHLRRYDYDVVHAHLFPAQLWTAAARRASGARARWFTTEHSYSTRRRRWFARPFDAWLYGQFDAVSCVSESAAGSFRAWLPEYRRRTHAISNGFDPVRFAAPTDHTAESTRILSVGRLEPVKRHDVTLRALAALPEANLWIAGDGPGRAQLAALSERLGVAERVRFLGRRQDVETLLRQCGVFVQSSDHEGFGLAALEAMACGVPVVCSDIPGLRDAAGPAAMKFAPGDDTALAGCLRSIFGNARLAAAMSNAGRSRARNFSISATANGYLRLYGWTPAADCPSPESQGVKA
jgi:glycosyltransferase involved in cell wall biosynthesis